MTAPQLARRLIDGEVIYAEGSISDHLWRVNDGIVALWRVAPGGALRVAVVEAGDLFGEEVLDGMVRATTARAEGAATVVRLSPDEVAALSAGPAAALVRATSARLRQSMAHVVAPKRGLPSWLTRWNRTQRAEALRLEFIPDALAIEARPAPPAARALVWVACAFFATAVTWGSLAEIDRLVIAPGKLVTTAARIVVQPRETSIVRSIQAHVGQIVAEGQVLVSLDPTFAAADEGAARAQTTSSEAEIRRLEAEMAGVPSSDPPKVSDDSAEQLAQSEIFRRRQGEREALARSYDEQIREMEAKLTATRRDHANVIAQRDILTRMETMRSDLRAHGNGSLVALLEAQKAVSDNHREADRLAGEEVQTTQSIVSTKAKREAAASEAMGRVANELQTARRDLARATPQLRKQERLSGLIEQRAPARGMVLALGSQSVGSVVREGDTMVTMVPLDVPLEVDVAVDPKDIGHLRVGDAARVKLDAFPYQKYGTLDGHVTSINGDVVDEEVEGRKVHTYRMRVVVQPGGLRGVPPDFVLVPGMVTTVEVKIGRRRLISYFLYPIIRALDSGLREP